MKPDATCKPGAERGALSLLVLLLVSAMPATSAPSTAWRTYNEGVEAYAKGDYTNALQRWQELSIQQIPGSLQRPVWFQLGNVHFRLGEPLEPSAPEQAIELWTRSCEAYRSALTVRPHDRDVLHNLAFVERRLAKLLHRLGMDTFRAAEHKPLDEAIGLLRDSTEQLERAVFLDREAASMREDYEQVRRAFRERLKARAEKAETKADDLARQTNPWTEQQAEEAYRGALEDLGEARRPQVFAPGNDASQGLAAKNAKDTENVTRNAAQPTGDLAGADQSQRDPLEQSLADAQQRVEQKLSELLTRRGQREQKQGDQLAESGPDQALEHYESGLEHYRAALEAVASNEAARRGEREVLSAMERLHVREGKAELQRGKEALAQQSPRSAQALTEAVSQFEAALDLNAKNDEARAGAEEARRLLPEALNLSGRAELKAGDRAEPRSSSDALMHYQEAEKDFRESLELKPGQTVAQKGLKEAEEKLARSRQRAEQEAEAAAKAGQPRNQPPQDLKSLLGQVTEKQRTPELDRERQRGVRSYGKRAPHSDW